MYIFTIEKELFKVTEQGELLEVSPGKFKNLKDGEYGIHCNERYIVFEEDMVSPYESSERMTYIYDIDKDILNGISIKELRNVATDLKKKSNKKSENNTNQTNNSDSEEIDEKQKFDLVTLLGITGKYCVIGDYKMRVYHMIELDSVSDEKISSWNIKF